MPFARPTLAEIVERTRADLESRLPGTDARLRRSLLRALSRQQAGVAHGNYGYLDWIARQMRPSSADAEILDEFAALYVGSRVAATYATGAVDLTGTDGSVIPAGTTLETGDGIQYTTDADATIKGGNAQADVTAVEPGEAGNQPAGVTVSLTSPIAGVESQATVAAGGLDGGADTETDESLRARIQKRLREPPQGGAKRDYRQWALAAHPDVTRIWVAGQENGPNTVTVRLMTDEATSDGIPTQQVVDAVASYIEERRPVAASVSIVAPTPVPYDYEITDLEPNTQAVKDAIEAEVADMIRRDSEPGGTTRVTHLREAISIAAGETDHTLVSPTADKTHSVNEIAVSGTATWS